MEATMCSFFTHDKVRKYCKMMAGQVEYIHDSSTMVSGRKDCRPPKPEISGKLPFEMLNNFNFLDRKKKGGLISEV